MGANVIDNRLGSRFELHLDGEVAGILDYRRDTGGVSFVEVTTDLRRAGQGLGLMLVRQALDAVSAEGRSVVPVCPFVRDFILRHPVYLDLVPAELRDRFELPLAE